MAHAFDAAEWLHSLTQAGGSYVLASDRRLCLGLDYVTAEPATVGGILRQLAVPDRLEAVKCAIENRQLREVR